MLKAFFPRCRSTPTCNSWALPTPMPRSSPNTRRSTRSPRRSLYKSEANMIERTHPQAVLVYTSIGEHRHAIEIAAQYGVSVMVEKPLTISLADALAIRETARHYKIHVLVNYETTWYASNKSAYDDVEQGRLGPIRRVVVHDGHEGPEGDRRPSRVPRLAHRPRAERRRRSLRLRLLRRRPDDLAHARRNPAHRNRRRHPRQAGDLSAGSTTTRRSC